MKRGIYFLVFALGLIFLQGGAAQIFACDCLEPQPTLCESYGTANAVFVGEVVEGSTPDVAPESLRTSNRFVFKIKKNFAGTEEGKTLEIITGNGDCAVPFRKGATYLVFAYQSSTMLYTTVCSPTRRVSDASDNFDEIQNLLRADGAQIYGLVSFWAKLFGSAESANQSLANFTLQIEQTDGAQKKYPLTTDTDGKYKLANLPAGKYKITPSIPAGFKIGSLQTREFTLNEKGCARKDLYFYNDSFIKGRVVDAYEKTVGGIPVDLIPADLISPTDFSFKPEFAERRAGMGFTNASGEFSKNSVPPGKYYLAVNFNYLPSAKYPYPTTFYRAPNEKASATVIEIGTGQKIENLVLRLPAPLATKEIRGKVFWRYGRPAANVFVYIRDAARFQFISTARTDKDGNFVLQGFAGRKYIISAHAGRSFELMNFELKAPDAEFILGDDTGEFKLILEKNPDFKTN